jgi:hypothetical protein
MGGMIAMPYDLDGARQLEEELGANSPEWRLKGDELRQKLEEFQRENPGSGLFALGSSRRIGVATSQLGKQLADYFGVAHGVLVNSVEANSPAEKAGLKAGDIITEADGQQVDDAGDLMRALGRKDEGEVTLTVVRDRKQRTVRVTPERRSLPQGFLMGPGTVRVVPPAVSVVPPSVHVMPPRVIVEPDTLSGPSVVVAPRTRVRVPRVHVPRVRVPRVRVFAPGDAIL